MDGYNKITQQQKWIFSEMLNLMLASRLTYLKTFVYLSRMISEIQWRF
jgi:hypothetical protein